jgi:2-polyprenyl-3-methyl-5-hydroxy-6-metoxy-1,4-benzoquinol methylase
LAPGCGTVDNTTSQLPRKRRGAIRILDFGGDTGINTPFRLAVADIDIDDISTAQTLAGVRKVLPAYALTQNYDLVVCSMVLERVVNPDDTLREICKYLEPESLHYIEVPYEEIMRDSNDPLQAIQSKRHWHEHINFSRHNLFQHF